MSKAMSATSRRARGHAVAIVRDQWTAVSVTPTAPDRWRLERCERHSDALPSDLVRDLKRDPARLAWLLAADDVSMALTPLPRLRRRELARAVAGWVARKEGGDPNDWVLSWRVLPDGLADDGRQEVYLAYAARSLIDREATAAQRLGLVPGVMLPPALLLDQLFRRVHRGPDAPRLWSLVFIGEHTSTICVANRACLLLARTLSRDLAEGLGDDEYVQRLVTEVDRSVFFARQTEGAAGVDRIVITGDEALAPRLQASLKERSELASDLWPLTSVIDPMGHTVGADDQLLMAAAALACGEVAENLALASSRAWLGPQTRRRLLVAAGTAGVALIPLLAIGGLVTSRVQEHYLAGARERLVTATERAEVAAAVYERQRLLNARVAHLQRFTTERPDVAAVLAGLSAITPPEVRFRDLQVVDRGDRVLLHLSAESTAGTVTAAQQAFLTFHERLGASAYLRPIGEPRQLQITEQDQEGRARKAVIFSLDYELIGVRTAREG